MSTAPRLADAGSSALTVGAVVRQRALMHPLRDALIESGRHVSYAQLCERVDRLVNVLHGLGVRRLDRVAILSENRCEFVEAILACAVLGAVASCHNWRQTGTEMAHCFGLTRPRVVLASLRHAGRLGTVSHGAQHVVLFGPDYEEMLARASMRTMPIAANPEDGLLIIYTSGTTGLPKAAVISHRAEVARTMIGAVDGQLYPGLGSICWSPLFHVAGTDLVLGLLMQGDTAYLLDGFKPDEMVDIMSRVALGMVSLMPAAIGKMIDELQRTGLRPRSLKACGSMADLVPRHQIAEASSLLNAEFRNSFGSTETGQPPASRHRFKIGEVPERMSKVQSSYCDLRLVDDEGHDVPVGEAGEVLVRSPSLFSGYWNASDATAEAFAGGWYHMGDVMRRNPDGTLDFIDRRKYLIKSGGENIYPAEIERVLLADRRIKDAAVVRQPDAHWGEVPVAFVVAVEPALREADVLEICRSSIASYKMPKAVYFIDDADMPRTGETSKVKRHELEQRLAKMRSTACL